MKRLIYHLGVIPLLLVNYLLFFWILSDFYGKFKLIRCGFQVKLSYNQILELLGIFISFLFLICLISVFYPLTLIILLFSYGFHYFYPFYFYLWIYFVIPKICWPKNSGWFRRNIQRYMSGWEISEHSTLVMWLGLAPNFPAENKGRSLEELECRKIKSTPR